MTHRPSASRTTGQVAADSTKRSLRRAAHATQFISPELLQRIKALGVLSGTNVDQP